MDIEFKTRSSQSNFVLLSCDVSHLEAFEVRRCLNTHAKSGILPRCFEISKIRSSCNRDTISTWYCHH